MSDDRVKGRRQDQGRRDQGGCARSGRPEAQAGRRRIKSPARCRTPSAASRMRCAARRPSRRRPSLTPVNRKFPADARARLTGPCRNGSSPDSRLVTCVPEVSWLRQPSQPSLLSGQVLPRHLERAKLGLAGIESDRRWMVSDNGRFLTQRELPKLALVVPKLESSGLVLDRARHARNPVAEHAMGPPKYGVWGDKCPALEVSGEVGDMAVAISGTRRPSWCASILEGAAQRSEWTVASRHATSSRTAFC